MILAKNYSGSQWLINATQKGYFSVKIFVLIVLSFHMVLVLGGLQVYVSTEAAVGFDFQKLINDGLPK